MLVELDDDPGTPAPQGRTGRARRRWPAALPLVVVLALVVAQLVADARERVRLAALADVPGVLAPLPEPPAVAWYLAGDATDDVLVDRDVLLEERVTDRGAMSLVAHAVATGDVRWSVPLADAPDAPEPGRYGLQCVRGPGDAVTCLVHDATDGDPTNAARPPGHAATAASVAVVEAGEVAARYPAGAGDEVAAAVGVVGDALVLAAPLDDGTAVWALDARTGDERWRVHAATGLGGGVLRWGATTRVVPVGDDAVGVLGAGTVLLDAADGATLASAGTLATVVGARQDGTALVVGSEGFTRLVGPAGEVRLDGVPVRVTVDDGSVPGLALTTGGGLRAWDARSGEQRWRTDAPAQGALLLGGLLHAHDGFRVATLDAGTGEVRWEATAPELFHDELALVTHLATDGRRLLVAGSSPTTARALLVALDPGDGLVTWRADLAALGAPSHVEVGGGALLGVGAQGNAVLAPRGRRPGHAGGRRTSQRASRRSSAARAGVR
ncbi:hypothetical protein Cfla_0060 [Cellulomonas flavigena DSM 20109]|uniref:Pyrrolo-quinoline quinone repeat domain-containing protein n=1 Tax=Cellulomonas flavigena (strain ATCC 482 / DSM 20109 / BCRC 11376 / JCM 18109 / NBRC 3775 / NCIMB 8073 / NRS 134) TaxID=446466 RepID=D5UFM1_CELFN|nr:hypothetical protein Cfla_0060 [Cellulomonas flavigena DSM 20109]